MATKHTEAEMEQMSFEDLKKNAADPEAAAAPAKKDEPAAAAATVEEPERFLARREIDLGDGSGVQVYEAEGDSEKEALEALADKITDAQVNATKKIREQETELRTLRAKNAEPAKPKEISADDEYILSQEFQKAPLATQRKMLKELTGFEVEDIAEAVRNAKENKAQNERQRTAEQTGNAISTFIASHADYEDEGKEGTRNGAMMNQYLISQRLPATSENLHKAYLHLKESGLLELKGEEANSEASGKTEEQERIVPPKVDPAPQRTKKTSSISTHSRATPAPVNTEPSEADMYKLPMEEVRARANRQMSGR